MTRRGFLVGCLLAGGLFRPSFGEDLILHVATEAHPHVKAIMDGRVPVQGCSVRYSTRTLESMARDMNGEKQLDVIEVDLLPYLEKQSAGEWSDYTLIPIFLSRSFKLRNIFIRTDRGIQTPADLRGKKVGVAGYASTTPTLLRGVLQSTWSVKPEEITWVDTESLTGSRQSLSDLLKAGKVDAIFTTDEPEGLSDPKAKVARLFPDYRSMEYEIFKETRVFPILTAVAIKKELVKENPWLPESVFIAFSEAKQKAMADLTLPLPWGGAKLDETEELMGKNFWSYGVKSNPKTLAAEFRFAHEQGILKKPLEIDDVFEPSTIMLLEN
jgi:4,5-dihydroxyphthalate decarboxylase